jgi:pimeloyl-ACP methyl ester carboxylesterase
VLGYAANVIEIHHDELDGLPVVWRSAPGDDPPVLWLHGVPDYGELWTPFLQQAGGVAPDLPGFGGSAKRGDLDYSIDGYADWLERFCDHAGLDRVRLVMHDWGVVGLAFAQRHPERIERLVAIDVVPFLPGYRWHPIARVWRVPLLGEAAMGMAIGPVMRRLLPPGRAPTVLEAFDPGTQRAILRLYRSSPPEALARAGARLGEIGAPALVLQGERDRYIPARFADGLAAALGDGRVEHVADAGHWPWLDDRGVISRVNRFITGHQPR